MKKVLYTTILVLLLSMAGFSIIIYKTYLTTQEIMVEKNEHQNTLWTHQTSKYIENYFDYLKRLIVIMGNSPEIQYFDKEPTLNYVKNFYENFKGNAIIDIGLNDSNGVVQSAINGKHLIGQNLSYRDYFQWALKKENKNKIFITQTMKVLTKKNGVQGVIIVYPIYETIPTKFNPKPSNNFKGILLFVVQIDTLFKELLTPINLLKTSDVLLLEDTGNFLFLLKHSYMVNKNINSFLKDSPNHDLINIQQNAFKQKHGSLNYKWKYKNNPKTFEEIFLNYRVINLGNRSWLLGVAVAKQIFFEQVFSTFKKSIFSVGIVILILSFTGIILAIAFKNLQVMKIQEKEKIVLEEKIAEATQQLNKKNTELENKNIIFKKLNSDLEIFQNKLLLSEEKYRTLIETSFAGIAIIQNDLFVFTNKKFQEILEYNQNELQNTSVNKYIEKTSKDLLKNNMENILNKKFELLNFEIKIISKSNKIYDINIWLNQIEYEKQKAIRMSIQNITQAKQDAIELKKTKEKLSAIFNGITDAINVIDKNYIIEEANYCRTKLHGEKSDDILGKRCFEVFRKSSHLCNNCPAEETFMTGKISHREYFTKRPDGTEIMADVYTFPLFNDKNEVMHIIEYVRDITDKKRLENELLQSQKMESIGLLAGGIAHDFNNFLREMLEITSSIKTEVSPSGNLYHQLGIIERTATKAGELTSQLLTFAKVGKYNTYPLSTNKVIEDTLQLLSHSISKNIIIKTKLEPKIYLINGNENQIQHSILNICLNSKDAMPHGGELIIETKNRYVDALYAEKRPGLKIGDYVEILITDTGIGMDNETQLKIFEPFFTTKKDEKRTGLGMSMVYGIVENHGGYINVLSKINKGTTVTIYFPSLLLQNSNTLKAKDKQDNTSIITLFKKKETILVVDDEEYICNLIRILLESKGYKVYSANLSEQAIDLFKKYSDEISLVMCDITMPHKDGEKILEEIKNIKANVKVIFLGGNKKENEVQELLEKSANDFIQKPFKMSDIIQKVKKVLSPS